MLKREFWHKAQSMVEYAVIIATIAAALAALGIFFRAGLQDKLFGLANELSDRPYFPRMTTSSSLGTASTTTTETYSRGETNVQHSETTSKSGTETVRPETSSSTGGGGGGTGGGGGGTGGGDDGGGSGGGGGDIAN